MKVKGTLLQIAQLGDPILRKKAKVVGNVSEPLIQQLIDDLIATVNDVDGVGISAPQVYQSIRLFILASHPSPRYPNAPVMKPTAIINPRITSLSKDLARDWEGCLSIPGIRAMIPRSAKVSVEYTTRQGKKIKKDFQDFIARIFQHEFDHLEGLVFLDRLESPKDVVTEKEYQKLIKKKVKNEKRN